MLIELANRQVTCIKKRGSNYNPHERIQIIGGLGWKHAEADAIHWLKIGVESYFVSHDGRAVRVIVANHLGRDYLKAEADDYSPDKLLALPECL